MSSTFPIISPLSVQSFCQVSPSVIASIIYSISLTEVTVLLHVPEIPALNLGLQTAYRVSGRLYFVSSPDKRTDGASN
jgi:hypothetical protein